MNCPDHPNPAIPTGPRWWQRMAGYLSGAYRTSREERAELALWGAFTTFEQACERTARFVTEELPATPYHGGPINDETRQIAAELAHANRAGLLTTGSQPGCDEYDGEGRNWTQRPGVTGWCDDLVRAQLEDLFGESTDIRMHFLRTADTRRIDYDTATLVTSIDGVGHTHFGAHLSAKEVDWEWQGCTDALLEAIEDRWQVTVVDMRWGDHSDLWDGLLKLEAR